MSTQTEKGLTLEVLAVAMAKVPHTKMLCGIVCRPEYTDAIRGLAKEVEREFYTFPQPLFGFGTPIYTDHEQEEPWIPFFDRHLLRVYLNRNEPITPADKQREEQ